VAAVGIVWILAGPRFAWLGPMALALLPRFWGHSFFNPKDIPFAAMLTMGTFLGARLLGVYHSANQSGLKPGLNRITAYSLLYGGMVGLVTGTRVAGCLLLGFVMVAHVISVIRDKSTLVGFMRFWAQYLLMGLAWAAIMIIIFPASWSGPARWFIEAITLLSKYEIWQGSNLFNGQYIPASYAQWFYLPVWLLITTPVIFQLLFAAGVD
jgi:hypothetical protein